MSLIWFLVGVLVGFFAYHHFAARMLKMLGLSTHTTTRVVQGLSHDAFIKLRTAVENEDERRIKDR